MTRLAFAVGILLPTTGAAIAQEIVFPGESWEVVTPEEMFIDSAKLEVAIAKLPDSSRTMVIRNGRVIWQGSKIDETFGIASITKAFASTALGLLIDDGKLTLDTPVVKFNPSLGEAYADVTFRHLTTQTSNIQSNIFNPSPPHFVPSGSQFYYNTDGNNALSHGIQVAAGQNLENFLATRILEPTGMDVSNFDFQDVSLVNDGERVTFNNARSGVQTTANNIARFGLLFMNGGEWDGERLLSEDWVETATTAQAVGLPVHPASPDYTEIYAMGGWARGGFGPGPYEQSSFSSYGAGNNRLYVDPASGFVVASLGNDSGPTTYAASDELIAALYRAEIPFVWDGQGDGDWYETAQLGVSRWVFNEQKQEDFPQFKSVIHDNRVTINQDLRIHEIRIESEGKLVLPVDRTLDLSDLGIDSGSAHLDGIGNIDDIDVSDGGHLGAFPNGKLNIGNLAVSGGTVSLEGSAEVANLIASRRSYVSIGSKVDRMGAWNVRDSQLRLTNGSTPIQLTGPAQNLRNSTLTLFLSGPEWGRTIELDEQVSRWSARGSKLELEFDPQSNPVELEGSSIKLFDWGDARVSPFDDIVTPIRIEADASDFYSTGIIQINSVHSTPKLPGDFNGDERLDAVDVDLLARRIQITSPDLYYDANADGTLSLSDFGYWLSDLKNTRPGDANLDGQVNFADFTVLQGSFGLAGGYAEGDFDLSGEIGFEDFLILSANFGTMPTAISVPEPPHGNIVAAFVLVFLFIRRLSWRRRFRVTPEAIPRSYSTNLTLLAR